VKMKVYLNLSKIIEFNSNFLANKYYRAQKVKKCVRENQNKGGVVLLCIFLLYTGKFLITYILFIL
jgi:hypothetical protein